MNALIYGSFVRGIRLFKLNKADKLKSFLCLLWFYSVVVIDFPMCFYCITLLIQLFRGGSAENKLNVSLHARFSLKQPDVIAGAQRKEFMNQPCWGFIYKPTHMCVFQVLTVNFRLYLTNKGILIKYIYIYSSATAFFCNALELFKGVFLLWNSSQLSPHVIFVLYTCGHFIILTCLNVTAFDISK